MEIYIVVSNGEVYGEIEGAFTKYEDAKACFDSIKKDWKEWRADDDCEEDDQEEYYSVSNYDQDEFLEVEIKHVELK